MARPAETYRAARRNLWRRLKNTSKWTKWPAFNKTIQQNAKGEK
jgi:hypothetical protein